MRKKSKILTKVWNSAGLNLSKTVITETAKRKTVVKESAKVSHGLFAIIFSIPILGMIVKRLKNIIIKSPSGWEAKGELETSEAKKGTLSEQGIIDAEVEEGPERLPLEEKED